MNKEFFNFYLFEIRLCACIYYFCLYKLLPDLAISTHQQQVKQQLYNYRILKKINATKKKLMKKRKVGVCKNEGR